MNRCIVCRAPLMEPPLLVCEKMPASAQNIPSAEEIGQETGIDLSLYQCSGCGLVQFNCEPVDYYRDVIRAGGYSTTMKALRQAQYRHFIETCGLTGKRIVEIGCGQGEFLQVLTEFPVKCYGIENKLDLVQKAREKGLTVWQEFAEDWDTLLPEGPFDAFLSFNFLEHQPNPNGMMQCISRNLVPGGYGLVTVPSFEYILENDGFYELLRDHIANYTEDTLRFLMEKNGFSVLETQRVNRDTISMIVRKRLPVDVSGLQNNFSLLSRQMQQFVSSHLSEGKKIAIWGASHQGFTAASTTGVADSVSYIIDSAPFKQGRFAPASHIPIVSPDHFFQEPVDAILIIAPGYTEEIAGIIRDRFGAQVEISILRSARIETVRPDGQRTQKEQKQ